MLYLYSFWALVVLYEVQLDNNGKYTIAFLYSNWLNFLWHGMKHNIQSTVLCVAHFLLCSHDTMD